jgi:uncharacterized BrkB/YihY/UPF0761 family membrane protein
VGAAGPEPPPEANEEAGGRVASARHRAEVASAAARERVEDARRRFPIVRRAFDVADRDAERLGGLLAGALAYRLFLWLLPFALFTVGLLGAITSIDDGTPAEVSGNLGLHGALAEAVSDGAQEKGWWIAMIVGLFATLYAGVGAEKAIRISHAAAWGLPRGKSRSPVRATLGFAAVVLLLVVVTLLATWLRETREGPGIVATLLVGVLYFVVWMFVQVRLPHRPGHWTQLVPGALLVAVGVQAIHLFTVWYLVGRAERAESTYGAIGTALVILVWLYLVARLVVGAAVMNAELARKHGDDAPSEEPPERPRWKPGD